MAQQNLVINQGETFSQTIQVLDNLGNVFDLTNYSIRGQMRKSYTSSTFQDLHPTLSNTPTDGFFTISLSSTDSAALKAGRWVYDVEIISPGSVVTRVSEGIISVTPEVTR